MRVSLPGAIVAAAACAPPSTAPAVTPPPSGVAVAPEAPAADAGASAAPAVEPVVDLIHTVEATVAVDPSAAFHFDPARVPWAWRKDAVFGPAGDLRLVP